MLGIDLGTSCSKVIIGDPDWKNRSFAVPFRTPDESISSWLHPTRFGQAANLKMRLMDDPASVESHDLLACYLAGVIARSRDWFAVNSPPDYRRRELRWSLNLGFPGKSVGASTLALAYREIAANAVILASMPEPPSVELAGRVRRKEVGVPPFIQGTRIQLYPEIAAQLAGYINSPYRKRGNLLLIDVGAGTLDVSTIILHEDQQQDIVSFHCCEVEELGALRLHERRVQALERALPGCVRHPLEHFQDGASAIPERLQDLTQHSSPALRDVFKNVSDEFSDEVLAVALRCLIRFRVSQRQAHTNPGFDPWGRNLRFFLTGGGGRSLFYRKQLVQGPLEDNLAAQFTRWSAERARRQTLGEGLLLEQLPKPDDLQNIPSTLRADFDRLSVAYGLALGGKNLMKITATTNG